VTKDAMASLVRTTERSITFDPRAEQKRWTNLGACLVVILAGGTVYSFGAYSNTLKARLGLGQAQLEAAALSANVGNYIGVAGFFYDRFGAVASVKFGASLIGLGYGAQWLLMARGGGAYGPGDATGLLCVCCFVWGHGSGYLDCAAVGADAARTRGRGDSTADALARRGAGDRVLQARAWRASPSGGARSWACSSRSTGSRPRSRSSCLATGRPGRASSRASRSAPWACRSSAS